MNLPPFKILAVAVLAVLIVLAGNSFFKLMDTGLGYKAKVLCSGLFISQRPLQALLDEDLSAEDLWPLQAFAVQINPYLNTVESNLLGFNPRLAYFREGLGCTLAPADETRPDFESIQPTQTPPIEYTKTELPVALAPELNSVLNWAFQEPDPEHQRRTRAVVVLQHGKIIAERYGEGFGPDMPLAGWSLAKAALNALTGKLVLEHRLNLQDPVPVAAWQATGDRRQTITIEHLLQMTSGLEFTEAAGQPLADVTQMLMRTGDAAAYASNKPLLHNPGSHWQYASGNSNILSKIIRHRMSAQDYSNLPRRALFAPLGMKNAVLEPDATGNFVASSFFYATAREFAKLGQLYLQNGRWEDRQILPDGWAKYSATPAAAAPHYGAHFWLDLNDEYSASDPEPPLPTGAFHALGYEGQCVSIIPSHELVIVRLGLTRTPSAWRQDRFVNKVIAALGKIDPTKP